MDIILCKNPLDKETFEGALSMESGEIFLDLEGIRLGKDGTVSLLQFTRGGKDTRVFVLDIFQMPHFLAGRLQKILESEQWTKFMFDPRGDSSNLFEEYGIVMRNVVCLQLAEIAFDRQNGMRRRFVNSLANVIKRVTEQQEQEYICEIKDKGKSLFSPDRGGGYEVFEQRPLLPILVKYAAIDVEYLERIKQCFWDVLSVEWKEWVRFESHRRVSLAFSKGPLPTGKEACIAPL
jgi:exonuclease 3'-5' domain-containing protein 1